MKLRFFILFLIASCTVGFGQSLSKEKLADSLYKKAKNVWNSNHDSANYYLQLTLKLSQESGYLKGTANALKGLGFIAYSNAEAIQYYTRALSIREQIKDSVGIGISLMDISSIYATVGDKEKSIEYRKRSFAIRKKLNDFGGIAQCLIASGKYKLGENRPKEALIEFKEALTYRLKSGEVNGIAFAHVNIASVLLSLKAYDSAIYYAQLAKEEFTKANNKNALIWAVTILAESNFRLGNSVKAMHELLTDYKGNLSPNSLKLLSEIYESQKDYKQALSFQKQWIESNNNWLSEVNNEKTKKLAADFEFKIRQSQLKKEEENQLTEKKRHNNLEFLIIAVLLIIIFIFIVSLRQKVSERTANHLTFIGFLLFFEFLVILFEPRLQELTQNEPFLILLGNVTIALIITPIHSAVEKKFKSSLFNKHRPPDR